MTNLETDLKSAQFALRVDSHSDDDLLVGVVFDDLGHFELVVERHAAEQNPRRVDRQRAHLLSARKYKYPFAPSRAVGQAAKKVCGWYGLKFSFFPFKISEQS